MRLLLVFILLAPTLALAQKTKEEIQLNILSSYYEQDGQHSAVTGGLGTEELKDFATEITLVVPLDSVTSFSMFIHSNYYTSASSDRIDFNMSSASQHDLRLQIQLGMQKLRPAKNMSFGLKGGTSFESDYISKYLSGNVIKELADGRMNLSIHGSVYFDQWAIVLPQELRRENKQFFETDNRNTFQIGTQIERHLGPNLSAALFAELILQRGLLSTPFHRVYKEGEERVSPELFPNSRIKFPIGTSLSYSFGPRLFLKGRYRFYYDDFDVLSNSLELGLNFRASRFLSMSPFYRLHNQRQSKYFYPYQMAPADVLFHSSDFDISSFSSSKFGIGFRYHHIRRRLKKADNEKENYLKYLSFRIGKYSRTDGLASSFASFEMSFGRK